MSSITSIASLAMQAEIAGQSSKERRDAISLVPSSSQRELFNTATKTYAAALQSNAAALEYLRKRGLSQGSAASFQLGVVDAPLTGHEQYAGRLAIPYLTRSGAVGMSFRCIIHEDCKAEGCVKYLWPSGVDRRLFNTMALDVPSPVIAISEGEIDAIVATQEALPTVGAPGAESWQAFYGRCFKGYDVVYVLADDDDAGRRFADKVSRDVPQARQLFMTGGDVNSYVLENGADALRARIGV